MYTYIQNHLQYTITIVFRNRQPSIKHTAYAAATILAQFPSLGAYEACRLELTKLVFSFVLFDALQK